MITRRIALGFARGFNKTVSRLAVTERGPTAERRWNDSSSGQTDSAVLTIKVEENLSRSTASPRAGGRGRRAGKRGAEVFSMEKLADGRNFAGACKCKIDEAKIFNYR